MPSKRANMVGPLRGPSQPKIQNHNSVVAVHPLPMQMLHRFFVKN